MAKVFLSYARDDRDVADQIARQLQAKGFSVWWDWQIVGGADFRAAIAENLDAADKVVVIWSARSVKSDFVCDEASRARAAGKLVPIVIDGSPPPLGFGGLHTIQVLDWTNIPEDLVATLRGEAPATAPDLSANYRQPVRAATLSPIGAAEPTGLLRSLETEATDYLRWFVAMAANPSVAVKRVRDARARNAHIPYVFRIVLISILIGATLGAIIPDRPELMSRVRIFFVVGLLWLFLSLLVHGTARLFGGREDAATTVMLMMQALSFAYVASNFLTLLITLMAKHYEPLHRLTQETFGGVSTHYVLIGLQFLMLLYLVPMTVTRAHGFEGARWIIVSLTAAAFTVFLGLPVAIGGGC